MTTEEGRFVISFINGSPGLVVRGDSADEIDKNIHEILPVFKKFREAVEKGAQQKQERMTEEKGLNAVCATCGAKMEYKEGYSKKTGKPWKGMFCPNSVKGDNINHKAIWM